MTDTDEIIQYRKQYVIESDGNGGPYRSDVVYYRSDDAAEARAALTEHIGRLHPGAGGVFGGRLVWYVDLSVPLTFFDEVVTEWADQLQGSCGLRDMALDRDDRYLMVEHNVRGGYYLTSGDDPERLVQAHLGNEYAEDFTIEVLWDLVEKRRLTVTITAEVS